MRDHTSLHNLTFGDNSPTHRLTEVTWVYALRYLILTCAAWIGISMTAFSAHAQLYQANGELIPRTNNLTNIINQAPLNEGINVIGEASLVPEVFTPSATLKFSFIAEGGGYENAFGWYNLGDDVTDPNNRFIIFGCEVEPRTPYVTREVDFCGNPQWRGGAIGFFLITPERVNGSGRRNPNCALNDNIGYIYYSEPRLNINEDSNNRYVHHLVYRSNTFPNAFYFGFEDLYRGGDNDFEDALILVEGLLVGASPELCDLLDDDCDGRVDEGADVTCESACGRGVRICETGNLSACTAPEPTIEMCDGLDNDCDGALDEQLTRACDLGCGAGVEVCLAGAWSSCTAPTPQIEACNNVDEDCDGVIDELLTLPCVNGCGAIGVRRCRAGSFGQCEAPPPVAERCDAADNDCDGRLDEDVSQICENACGLGVERCESGEFVGCDAPLPESERCDGADNDCDGVVDEGLTRACSSVCGSVGEELCLGGSWVGCSATQPRPESCNLVDDDCDDVIDEALTRPCESACGQGAQRCDEGAWTACDAQTPQVEECDGIDNDCDTRIDEGVARACRAECGVGSQLCVNGVFLECAVPRPREELCDGEDNDCDGLIDESLERACDSSCGAGTELCVMGDWIDCNAPLPRSETCNALDDDCDGVIDEALIRPCDNPCGSSMSTCEVGRWSECPALNASDELCDGSDNDCDGQTDEQVICPEPSASCVRGECARPCESGECSVGFNCVEGYCVSEPCQSCRAYEVCERERCVDPCAEVTCDEGSFCRAGECVEGLCSAIGCDSGQICREGACVPDECELVRCGVDEACSDGSCFPTCLNTRCADSERCVRGVCIADTCRDVTCDEYERCVEGGCVPAPCSRAACPEGQACLEGRCIDDPCAYTRCPSESECTRNADGLTDCVRVDETRPDAGGGAAAGDDLNVTLERGGDDLATGASSGGAESSTERLAPAESLSGCDLYTQRAPHPPAQPLWLFALLGGAYVTLRRARRDGASRGEATLSAEPTPSLYLLLKLSLLISSLLASSSLLSGCDRGAEESTGGAPASFEESAATPFLVNGCAPKIEVCNGEDDDCDGVIDNVRDLDRNPDHCGACGQTCAYTNAIPSCVNGACRLSQCEPGFVNRDGVSVNGCEETCELNPEVELGVDLCNQRDDDCDGAVDEGVNLGSDIDHCGVCGQTCLTRGVSDASCLSGRCVINGCIEGYQNLDGEARNGCEYECEAAGAVEICNGADDDCDGAVDEGIVIEITCREEGLCAGSRAECLGEDGVVCTYPEGVELSGETRCDGRDEDCDGIIDEDFSGIGEPCDGEDADLCLNGTRVCSSDRAQVVCRERLNFDERCDTEDNDCDGRIDEGFILLIDPLNCGACGQSCELLNGVGVCVDGVCALDECREGFIDLDGVLETGCEYRCEVTRDATGEPTGERCDGVDDDCDGRVDEGVIAPPESTCLTRGVCGGSVAQCQGQDGFRCDYVERYEAGVELSCDGLDNDCDGEIDEDFPTLNSLCDGADVDLCLGGIVRCATEEERQEGQGLTVCTDDINALVERCDAIDNDCDGVIDEGFDLRSDNRNCGRCGAICERARAQAECSDGACMITACDSNTWDLNQLEIDGCEYTCTLSDTGEGDIGVERCNGVDDDCDGVIDEAVLPPVELRCGEATGVCAGLTPTCRGVEGFACLFPEGVYQETETWCDGLDNDCDGSTDEASANPALAQLGALCGAGVGACARQGIYLCTPDRAQVRCSAEAGAVSPEVCNGIDDDCDASIDEEISRDAEMELVNTASGSVWIDRWEASRPDATQAQMGINVTRACSKSNVIPWSNVTLDEARAACTARGKRLCDDQEWVSACGAVFPYGAQFDESVCSTDRDSVQLTGSEPGCESASGVFDLSGNLAEWTECARAVDCQIVSPQLGGSYADQVTDLWRCDFRGNAVPSLATATGGFRCCVDP